MGRAVTTSVVSPTRGDGHVTGLAPLAFLLLYGVLGGATFTLAKTAIGAGMTPLGYAAGQCLGALLLLAPLAALARQTPGRSRELWRFAAIAGTLGVALPLAAMYGAVRHLPAGAMGLILATMPLFTAVIAGLSGVERVGARRWAGVTIGALGFVAILAPGTVRGSGDGMAWVLVAFAAPPAYALGSLYTARARPAGPSPLGLTVAMLAVASVALGLLATASGALVMPARPLVAGLALGAQILVSSVGYLLFFEIVRRAGAVYFSQIGPIITLSAIAWAGALWRGAVARVLARRRARLRRALAGG